MHLAMDGVMYDTILSSHRAELSMSEGHEANESCERMQAGTINQVLVSLL